MTKHVDEIALLSGLQIAVLGHGISGALSLVGGPPPWTPDLLGPGQSHLTLHDLMLSSPFLADFFQEACNFWNSSGAILGSGTWSQRNLKGDEVAFEAWALRSGSRKFLLIKLLEDFEEHRRVFQRMREMELSHERLGLKHLELSRAKKALENRNREVERVNQLKSEFLASMSHELRTPLNAIIGFSRLLEEQNVGTLNTEQMNYVQHVAKAARHLLSLINDILDLSKIEAGRLEFNLESFELSEALTEVLSTIRPLARTKNINLVIRVSNHDTIYADRLRFKQILYNLFSNAIKFTPEFGDVAIDCSKETTYTVIHVTDNGIGVPLEEQEAIFEKFHQVRAYSNEVKEGSGLGLAITRRLVQAHGGNIWVTSRPGLGARFSFTLPSYATRAASPEAISGEKSESESQSRLASKVQRSSRL
jgi:signal transduction histidine kinase